MKCDLKGSQHNFFGYEVDVYPTEGSYAVWRYTLTKDGKTHWFAGIPNKCETKHSAMMKAYYMSKYLFKCEVLGCPNGLEVIE